MKVEGLKEYLKNNGINLAFQVIFSEIVTKKIEKEQVFAYTAMRLRQIGNDLNLLKKVFLFFMKKFCYFCILFRKMARFEKNSTIS